MARVPVTLRLDDKLVDALREQIDGRRLRTLSHVIEFGLWEWVEKLAPEIVDDDDEEEDDEEKDDEDDA